MYIISLMEKIEAGLYRIISYLKATGQPVSLKHLSQEVSLSRSTIRKYISLFKDFKAKTNLSVDLLLEEDICYFYLSESLEWSELLDLLLQSSVKYHILNYLFKKTSFTIQELAQELRVSEATLHRHLSALNESLAEFNISIYNGHWQGPEHQIRYFYWSLYRETWRVKDMIQELEHPAVMRELQLVERLCQAELTLMDRQSLGLWLHISHQRWLTDKMDGQLLSRLLTPYHDNIFFQRLERACLRYFSRYAVELDETESQVLFAFLVSMGILPHHSLNFLLGFGGPVAEQMTQAIHYLRQENICQSPLPQMVNDVLGQLLHHRYFFQGLLCSFPDEYHLETAYFSPFTELIHHELAERLFPETGKNQLVLTYYRWSFLALLAYLTRPVQNKLRIGLAIEGGQMTLNLMRASLGEEWVTQSLIELLPYQANQTYDGIIVSRFFAETVSCPLYRLQGPIQLVDKEKLKEWVQLLVANGS